MIGEHPTGSDWDSYIVKGSLYVWDGTSWVNVGEIKGEKGDTGVKGDTGDKGSTDDIVPNEKKVMLEQVPMLMLIMKVES